MTFDFDEHDWERFISVCCFTDKELEVIPFLKRGWYGEDIAAELHVSRRTVCRLKKRISNKILKQL